MAKLKARTGLFFWFDHNLLQNTMSAHRQYNVTVLCESLRAIKTVYEFPCNFDSLLADSRNPIIIAY